MKHRPSLRARVFFASLLGLLPALAPAQGNSGNAPGNSNTPGANASATGAANAAPNSAAAKSAADLAWDALSAKRTPATGPVGNGVSNSTAGRTAAQALADDQKQVAQHKAVAAAAASFHQTHPTDTRALEAKKVEALSLLHAARHTDADRGQAALQTATAFRTNPGHSAKDRFEVAALIERQQFAVQNRGTLLARSAVPHEQAADRLRTEFGDTTDVHLFYLGVINTADADNADRVARKLQALPVSKSVRTEAQVTIDRHAQIGKKQDRALKDAEGKSLTLGVTGKVSVVFVWSPVSTPSALKALATYKSPALAGARWVYVAMNATSPALEFQKAQVPYPGTFCLELPGSLGPVSDQLKVRHLPYVYVLDSTGALVGYGGLEALPGLLKSAR